MQPPPLPPRQPLYIQPPRDNVNRLAGVILAAFAIFGSFWLLYWIGFIVFCLFLDPAHQPFPHH